MATPTKPERRLLAVGAAKGATWGTEIALGANKEILVDGLGGFEKNRPYLPAKEADTPFVMEGDLGDEDAVDFSADFFMRYDMGQLMSIIAGMFGTAGVPSQQGGTAAYKHTIQWADSIYGLFFTLAAEFPSKIFSVPSAKPISLGISLADGLMRGSLNMRGNTIINNSVVNTATQMDALTAIDRFNRMKMSQMTVKMNAQSGGDVTSETALELNDISIDIARGAPDSEHKAGDTKIIEPVEGDHPELKVHLGFPRMDSVNNAFFATFDAETEQKILISFTGALIEGAYYYDFKIYLPRMRMVKPIYSWDEIVKAGLDLVAEEAASNPTGMSHARPYLELINKQTTDYLA